MTIKKIVAWGSRNPKKLFQIDGIGAVLSAFLLGVVLVKWEALFGIPRSTLYFLAVLPCFFAIYDVYCYLKIDKKQGVYLQGIAIINLIYCCLSLGLAISHKEKITNLGWMYIVTEIVIVGGLAYIELKVAQKIN